MRHIVDTFESMGVTLPIDRQIPEPEDVRKVMPKRLAELAIQILGCEEAYAREHLRIGSTPPPRSLSLLKFKRRHKLIQRTLYNFFKEVFICN